jgi:hypothetical protein
MHRLVTALFAASLLAFAPAPAHAEQNPPDAHLLSEAQYEALGMPAPDHAWTVSEVEAASNTLQTLQANQLPRSNNPETVAIFQHITDRAVLAPCSDKATPVAERLQVCLQLVHSYDVIIHKYGEAQRTDATYRDDAVRIVVLILNVVTAVDPVAGEFAATLDSSDASYPTRMHGLQQIRVGEAQIFQGAIVGLTTERRIYSDAVLVSLARAFAEAYPSVAPKLPSDTKAGFDASIATIARTDSNADIRAALAPLVNSAP